jgi:D-sedoheptulose 7-phosphate isomerase
MENFINGYIEKLKAALDKLDRAEVERFISALLKAKDNENTVFIMGNGGSASTASHFLGDIAKEIKTGKRFKIVCLNDNIPIITAYANDVHYDDIFVEQLKNFLKPDDLVIGISGSGISKNIMKAIEYAAQKGAVTVGFTGYGGGRLKEISDLSVNANVYDMQISQDIHMAVVHIVMKVLMQG